MRLVVLPDESLLRHESNFQFEASPVSVPAAGATPAQEPAAPATEEPRKIITVPGKKTNRATAKPETADGQADTETSGEAPRKSARRGRRGGRRRSRKPSSETSGNPQEIQAGAAEKKPHAATPPTPPAPVVPANVRSDELMPAAAPRGNDRGRGRGRGGRN